MKFKIGDRVIAQRGAPYGSSESFLWLLRSTYKK